MKKIVTKILRKLYRYFNQNNDACWRSNSRIEYYGEKANDYVFVRIEEALQEKKGLAISKFGTIELSNICAYLAKENGTSFADICDYIKGIHDIYPEDSIKALCINAGFFPEKEEYLEKYVNLVLNDVQCVDILGSYIYEEKYIEKHIKNCVNIEIEGYYAPFLYEKPWTKVLEGKKVLVIHPFVDSIRHQYEQNRTKLFDNLDVLPEFSELITIKAVQSIAGNGINTGFKDWFEALDYMKNEMDKYDYDVALIGCGAYGMDLAAHAKRKGKVAVHMAGWTQMLFGIYGNRWLEDQPEYRKYINEYWIRPSEEEKPKGIEKVENGCYW